MHRARTRRVSKSSPLEPGACIRRPVYGCGTDGYYIDIAKSGEMKFIPMERTKDVQVGNVQTEAETSTVRRGKIKIRSTPKQEPPKPSSDLQRIQKRSNQIQKGKDTKGYKNYISLISKSQRSSEHPVTPDPGWKISKRRFDSTVGCWRRALHEYDNVEIREAGSGIAGKLDFNADEKSRRHNTKLKTPHMNKKYAETNETSTHSYITVQHSVEGCVTNFEAIEVSNVEHTFTFKNDPFGFCRASIAATI